MTLHSMAYLLRGVRLLCCMRPCVYTRMGMALCMNSETWSGNEDIHRVHNFRLTTHADKQATDSRTTPERLREASVAPYGNAVAVQLEALGVQFDWRLQLNRQIFAEGATVRAVLTNGTVFERPARSVSYTGTNGQDGGWVRLVVTTGGSIRGVYLLLSLRLFVYLHRKLLMRGYGTTAFFLYQQELYVAQPSALLQHQHDWQRHAANTLHGLKDNDLVVYKYSSTHSDSSASQYVNSILHRVREDPSLASAPRTAAQQPELKDETSTRDSSDASPYHEARRLNTQPVIFHGCIAWTNAPYGKMDSTCPSVTQEIKIGVAHDTGFTKALTGYGTTGISEMDAIDIVEEDAIMNNNILNVLMGE